MKKLDFGALDAHIKARMEKESIPGLSVTFSDADGTLFERAYGHIDQNGEKPTTPDTIMGIASLSKSFTGTCIALLEHEGKLSIKDPVTRFFPDFQIPGTPKDAVLIHHLLTHTTGLPPLPLLMHSIAAHTTPDPGQTPEFSGDDLIRVDTAQDIVDYIREGEYASLGQPGEYMSYSNDCYAVLCAIVDKAAGMPMERYIDEKLFQPLGMTRSDLGFERLGNFENVTSLFSKDKDGAVKASDNWCFGPPYRGCGWIASTSRDLHRYYKMLAQDGVLDGVRILPESVVDRLLGDHFPVLESGVYGYGLSKTPCRGQLLFTHSGGLKGVSSAGAFFKGTGVAGALLTNIGGVNAVRILAGAFNIVQGQPADAYTHNFKLSTRQPSEPWMFEGYYGGQESGHPAFKNPCRVARENGQLFITLPGGERHKLHYCGETLFMAAEEGKEPLREGMTVRFFVRGGKAWAAQSGSRMLQRL